MMSHKHNGGSGDGAHCESCGRTPNMTSDGYTECCNELACTGRQQYRFGTATDNVEACCWAKAEKLFEAAGRPVPEGSSRLRRLL